MFKRCSPAPRVQSSTPHTPRSPCQGLEEFPPLEQPVSPRRPLTAHPLSSGVSSASLLLSRLCAPSLRSLRFPGLSSSSPSSGRLCVHRPSVPSFLGRRHPHPPACVRPVCAPLAGVRQAVRVCARVAAQICVCELVSAWLTKAWACGEPREGRGGSVPPGDPGCGLQLALAGGLETPPSAPWRLGPEAGHKPGGAHREGARLKRCLMLLAHLWKSTPRLGPKWIQLGFYPESA